MYRLITTILFCSFLLNSVEAQQLPLLSNNIDNQMFINPAYSGINKYTEIRGVLRSQWHGIDDGPKSQYLGFVDGIDSLPIGYGLMMFNDGAALLNNIGAALMGSYNLNLGSNAILGIGVSGGLSQWSFDKNNATTGQGSDDAVNGTQNGSLVPFVNFGLYLSAKNLVVSLSSPQTLELNASFESEDKKFENSINRHYNVTASYNIPLKEGVSFEPVVHCRYFVSAPFQFDAGARLHYKSFWLGGFYRLNDAISGQAGINFSDKLGLYYAYDATSSGLNVASMGSHEVGLAYFLGKNKDRDGDGIPDDEDDCPDEPGTIEDKGCPKKDKDGDGIPDVEDECPEVAGLAKYAGCPDTDGDGLIDKIDQCPKIAGKPENMGCPDTDGDGIPDNKDECPEIAGLEEHRGCPDSDGDGLSDKVDNCPLVFGPRENAGCPWSDSDGDGLLDNVDRCPTVPGPESNSGCPVQNVQDTDGDGIPDNIDDCPLTVGPKSNRGCPLISDQDKQTIYLALVNLEFEFDRAIIVGSSLPYLDRLAELMIRKYDWKLRIAGHTDNIGPDDYNMRLSRDRSYATRNYLMSRGMSGTQFIIEYYGETKPVDTNFTDEGRQRNRRVELEFKFD